MESRHSVTFLKAAELKVKDGLFCDDRINDITITTRISLRTVGVFERHRGT